MKKWPVLVPLLSVGFYVALSLLIPTIVGWWIGVRVHHEILFPLIGLGLGTIIMIYGVYRMLRPFLQELEWDEKDREQFRQPMRTILDLAFLKHGKGKNK
ncbi:MAG: AtpZ/AtpI family protein [Dehalococcoidia bacterium]|nr:AtpZ/AtpI family protein [Dehalococcoidia bacterium]